MCNRKKYLLLIIIGIIILLYPIIARFINQKGQNEIIANYSEQIEEMDEEDTSKQKEEYEKYNNEIIKNTNSNINLLQNGKNLGYIRIEKINLSMPIYEGTEDKILLKGVGHLEYTGIPTKKQDYHCVLVGHSGLTSKKIFDNLTKLKDGDEFNIIILDNVFKYKICSIKKVLPYETNYLTVQKGKQLVTLVTCIPKFINSHRLLVTGEII